jgi:ADP-ribose pyrophosphatase YjhB (NUDIX family)
MHCIPEMGYALTADVLVIARAPSLQVLLIQRGRPPFEGTWAIPGGFLEPHERIATCAVRELAEETGIRVQESDLILVGIYDDPARDPRGRVITVAYAVVVPAPLEVRGGDDAARAAWFPVESLPPLAFDHEAIVRDSLAHVRRMGLLA